MRRPVPIPPLPLSLALLAALAGCAPAEPGGADLILTGGAVWPELPATAPASAVAIGGDRILAVGDDASIRALAGDDTQEMPLDGATVLPGLVDAWVDVAALGRWSDGLDLRQAATPRELQARVRAAAAAPGDWIVGWGWDESRWPTPALPDAALLSGVAEDRPVLLYRFDGRLAWVNAAALEAAGLPPAAAGVIGDPHLADVEGVLPVTADQRRQWWTSGLLRLAAAGITRGATVPLAEADLDVLTRLQQDGELTVRVDARLRPDAPPASLVAGGRLRWAGYGVDLDGPLGTPLAALAGAPGDDRSARERLATACAMAAQRGVPLTVQVHGDRALEIALECEALADGTGLLVGADLLPAPGLPATARVAIAPGRFAHDIHFLGTVVGSAADRAHRYRDLASSGQLAGIASVAPSYLLAPMATARIMLTRRDLEGYPLDGWHPEQRLAPADSLAAALRSPVDGRPARLAAGEPADLVIWSEDPFGDPALLSRALPLLTIVDGRVVYSRPWTEPSMER